MGQQLVAQLLPALAKMQWPKNPNATLVGQTTYEEGVQQVNAYENNPKDLANALKTFRTGDSQPYAFGGIARVPEQIGGKAVRLGYSVPTKFGGTEVPLWEFGQRPVHLLGGGCVSEIVRASG